MPETPIDQDLYATWPQLFERLKEIRRLVEPLEGTTAKHVLEILNRPRETA